MKIKLIALLTIGALFSAPILEARSSSSGSRSSSSSRSSGGWGSSSKSSPKPSPAPAPKVNNQTSKPNTAQQQTSSRPTSNVDRAKYENAVKSGKSFTSREKAVADFKAKNATKYTAKFDKEPATRPSYIPTTYRDSSGTTRNIVYDNRGGGYGYWSGGNSGLGTFIMFDALSDMVMLNALMDKDGYYVGSPPVHNTSAHYYEDDDSTAWNVFKVFLGVVAGIVVIVFVVAWMKS